MKEVIARTKDADEKKDYSLDWTRHLTGVETIAASSWFIEGGDGALVVHQDGINAGAKSTTIWVSAGTQAQDYKLVNRVTTNSSPTRILERHIKLTISNN